jgi:4,5-DOPA dioxygenase extradiol
MTNELAPVVFFGHGKPLYALQNNRFTQAWASLQPALEHARGIVMISAHWYVNGSYATSMASPKTIHDFRGFPPEMYEVNYPAAGSPELAALVANLATSTAIELTDSWGLDHGAWSVLVHALPLANVPIVQLSVDASMAPSDHVELGRVLGELRADGYVIAGSGNVVHNLSYAQFQPDPHPYPWAIEFEAEVRRAIDNRDVEGLSDPNRLSPAAALSIPTPEHYLPLLPVMGALGESDSIEIVVDGIDAASISMLSFISR